MGQSILFVPTTALLTAITIPKKISEAICKDTTVHGLLAAWLCLDAIGPGKPTWSEWRAIWPSHRDIKESMPLLWEEELRRLLPAAAKGPKSKSLHCQIYPCSDFRSQIFYRCNKKSWRETTPQSARDSLI